jgi:hypothetical protein
MQEMKCIKCGREAVGHWATIARNDEIRDNITRMRQEWKRNAARFSDRPPLQRNAFRQRLCLVLAQDCSRANIKTSLADYRLRQLRDGC